MRETEFITDREIYSRVILERVPAAESFVWIGTADVKDLHVERGKGRMVPFLQVLSELLDQGVSVRLLHAKEPGPIFQRDFAKFPNLEEGLERVLCPRVHFKSVVVDGAFCYLGSANLTGAGMGAKGPHKRNFEHGVISTEAGLVEAVMEQFDHIWMGAACPPCQRKDICPTYPTLSESP